MTGHLQHAQLTDTGLKRSHNEDFVDSSLESNIFVLADGMGGHNAGEVASALAVSYVLDSMSHPLELDDTEVTTPSVDDICTSLKTSITGANIAIFDAQQNNPELQGMGTTIIAAKTLDNILCIGHVGDSRLYRIRGKKIKQITKDHSVLQELIDRGFYTPEEAATAPQKNLVTRALGTSESIEVDTYTTKMKSNDVFLICSDGLTDMVEDGQICLTINKFSANLSTAAHKLVEAANEQGGHDNISVLLLKYIETNNKPDALNNAAGILRKITNFLGNRK